MHTYIKKLILCALPLGFQGLQQRQGPQDSVHKQQHKSLEVPTDSRNKNMTTWKSSRAEMFSWLSSLSCLFGAIQFYLSSWNNSNRTELNGGSQYKKKELHRQARPFVKVAAIDNNQL